MLTPQHLENNSVYLRDVIDRIGEAYLLLDDHGHIRDVNRTTCEGLGYSREQLLAMSIYDIEVALRPDDLNFWKQANRQQVNVIRTSIYLCNENISRYVEQKISSMIVDSEFRYVIFATDITHRLETEKNLKFTQFAIDNAGDAAFWMNAIEPDFIYVNNKACEYLGYSKQELLAMSVLDINPKFSKDAWSDFMDQIVKEELMVFESFHKKKDDSFVPVEVKAKYMRYGDNGYVITFVRDITRRINSQKQLHDAKVNAESANNAKSVYLTGMSHELKTPLNAILGYSELLQETDAPQLSVEQLLYTQTINKAGHLMLGLISEVLDLAKIEAGQVDLNLKLYSLDSLLTDTLEIISPIADKRKINVCTADFKKGDIQVYCDLSKTTQIFLNLMSNGVKYNVENGSLNVGYQILDNFVKIIFSDTGHGIPIERQKELFTAFSRLEFEDSNIEGSGIGLVVCKQLVELMNGKIGFKSTPGKGSIFWITLPLSDI